MRSLIIILALLVSTPALAGELVPGALYTDYHGCDWYVIERTHERPGAVRVVNGVRQFVVQHDWTDYESCGHLCSGTEASRAAGERGCIKIPLIIPADESYTGEKMEAQCSSWHRPVASHTNYLWAVPTGNCRGNQ